MIQDLSWKTKTASFDKKTKFVLTPCESTISSINFGFEKNHRLTFDCEQLGESTHT
jgi:hypothetical protein